MSRVVAIGIVLLLSGCGFWGGAASLEAAVNEAATRGPQRVVAGPEIKLVRPIEGGAAVLYTHVIEENGSRIAMTSVYFFERRFWSWFPVSGAGGGGSADAPRQPVEYSVGGGRLAEREYIHVFGLVNDPAVTQIAVTFPDGRRSITDVENGAYLLVEPAARVPPEQNIIGLLPGDGIRIEALDAQGNVLHTNQP